MLSKNSSLAVAAVVLVVLGTVFMVANYTRPGGANGAGSATEDRMLQIARANARDQAEQAYLKARQSTRAILGDIVVEGGPGGSIPQCMRLAGKLERSIGEIDAAYPVLLAAGTIKLKGPGEPVEIIGVDSEFLARMSQRAPFVRHMGSLNPPGARGGGEAGRPPPGGIVLSSGVLREEAGGLIGQDVRLLVNARKDAPENAGERDFRVAGIISGVAGGIRAAVFINFHVAVKMAAKGDSCSEIRIVLKGAQPADSRVSAIAARVSDIAAKHADGLTATASFARHSQHTKSLKSQWDAMKDPSAGGRAASQPH